MEKKNSNKAIILAAGEGTRLRPYTLDRPKCLVEVNGISLLDRQLSILATQSAVTSIVIIGGYLSDMLKRAELELRVNSRYAETNMVWTLFSAEDELQGNVLICYGDIVYSKEILEAVLASDADIAVAIDLDWESYWRQRNEDPLGDAETLKLRADGSIREIGKKPLSLDEIEGQYMGLMKFSAAGIALLKKTFHDAKKQGDLGGRPLEKAYMTDLLQAVIDAGHVVTSIPVRAGWVEVDTVSDLLSSVTEERLKQIAAGI